MSKLEDKVPKEDFMRSKLMGLCLLVSMLLFSSGNWAQRSPDSRKALPLATPTWAKSVENSFNGGVRMRQGMPDSEGGCLVVGDNGYSSNLDGWAAHFDKTGQILKQVNYSGKKHDRLYSICASDDKGYLSAGWTQFEISGITENSGLGLLMKIDAGLNPAWSKVYSGLKYTNFIPLVIKLKTKGYLAIMESWGDEDSGLVIMRLDSSGCIVWSRILKTDLAHYFPEISEIIQTPDGGFLLIGTLFIRDNSRKDGVIIKIDGKGNLKWAKAYGKTESYEEFYSAFLTAASDLMVFGCHYPDFTASHALVLKIDQNGNIKWQILYKKLGNNGFRFGLAGSGGGFYAVGNSDGSSSVQINYVKGDGTGKILSKKGYAAFYGPYPNYYETVSDAFWSSDGGIIVLNRLLWSYTDGYVAKMDANGILPKACQLMSVNIARSKSNFQQTEITFSYETITVIEKPAKITAKATSFTLNEACR